jgi:hypothetical protein
LIGQLVTIRTRDLTGQKSYSRVSLRLTNREAAVYEKRTISNILYNLIFTTKFNDSSILITIIWCDYLNLSLADEHVGDVTIPTQEYLKLYAFHKPLLRGLLSVN